MGGSLSPLRDGVLTRIRQGAFVSFEGDLTDPAEIAFAKFLSRPHDHHKAAQLGAFTYSNGSVRLYGFADELQVIEIKQVSFVLTLFYDGPEPPAELYDELLKLSSTTTAIYKGNFTDFISKQFLPPYTR